MERRALALRRLVHQAVELRGGGLIKARFSAQAEDPDRLQQAQRPQAVGVRSVLGLKRGQTIVRVDPRYFRPAEVESLLGDAAKARRRLGWKPRVSFARLVAEMARADLRAAERDALVGRYGYRAYGGRE